MSDTLSPSRSPLATKVQGALVSHLPGKPPQIPGLANALLAAALEAGVSDLHLIPHRSGVEVRFRLDGEMLPVATLPSEAREPLIQRLKIMAGLVVYQQREPQDGRIDAEIGEARVSLRVAFLPTLHGERAVVRFPDPLRGRLEMDQLGMSPDVFDALCRMISRSQGAVLLTGPASSGKTTTICAALRWLVAHRASDLSIMTIEDPIESEIAGVSQTQIDPGVDFGFARALRATLRQDPNVLVVGEIRDLETAAAAIQAALTGHLLIATVHAGSSPGVFTRLAQMGVERYLLATAVSGVVNQRLARCVCQDCARPVEVDEATARALEMDPGTLVRAGAGCEACHGTGCRTRIGIFELLDVTLEIRQAVLDGAPETEVSKMASEAERSALADDLRAKMIAGVIPPREALRLVE